MTKTVVHVTTLEQWKSVLNVWYKQGHYWLFTNTKYQESIFEDGGRYLFLDDYITYSNNNHHDKPFIEYSEFMAQQKEDSKMETYYVTEDQLDLINDLKESDFPVYKFYGSNKYEPLAVANKLSSKAEKMLLRYLGGDTSIEFKVKEQLYRLWRIDDVDDRVYMRFTSSGNPDWTMSKDVAFTAPIEEIKKWQTPAWEIEKVDD